MTNPLDKDSALESFLRHSKEWAGQFVSYEMAPNKESKIQL